MEDSKKLELIADILEEDAEGMTPDSKLDSFENWDSMAKLNLIVMVEDECSKKLTGSDIKGFATVRDIMDYMG